jgi:hypothetical protein
MLTRGHKYDGVYGENNVSSEAGGWALSKDLYAAITNTIPPMIIGDLNPQYRQVKCRFYRVLFMERLTPVSSSAFTHVG